ncbi:MAG: cytochrome d ubiquinol oxidase subunit II [Bradyrhizobium sp.]|nr:cytochrome d ubiquinol oxidase subunit II [Bradyrhizobium sp.]
MQPDLSIAWVGVIAFGLAMYVIMDGFDLGIGVLFPFVPDRGDRDLMVNTVAPVWDGNETWLVLGAAGLYAAFPLAYSIVLSALYLPLMFMLAGLIWRGVAFEFRFKADAAHRLFWDKAFAWGSYIATFFQGVSLGAFLNGIKVSGPSYAGGALDWLTPFSVFTGFGLIVAYALLGSTWLILKTEGDLQARMRSAARGTTLGLMAVIAIVSLWTPLGHPAIEARWFTLPDLLFFAPVPGLTVAVAVVLLLSLQQKAHVVPFIAALALLFLGYSGLGISIWPYIVPPELTIEAAAAPPQTQLFVLVGALITIPVILAYTAFAYYVFRGKVRAGEGYH